MTALRSSSFSIQVISASRSARVGPRHSGRRHHPGAKLADDFFADLGMVRRGARGPAWSSSRLAVLSFRVVAGHAILIDEGALGGRIGSSRLLLAQPKNRKRGRHTGEYEKSLIH